MTKRPAAIRVGDIVHLPRAGDQRVVGTLPGGRVRLSDGSGDVIVARIQDVRPSVKSSFLPEDTQLTALRGGFFETIDAVAPDVAAELGCEVLQLVREDDSVIANCKISWEPTNPIYAYSKRTRTVPVTFSEKAFKKCPGTVEDFITLAFIDTIVYLKRS